MYLNEIQMSLIAEALRHFCTQLRQEYSEDGGQTLMCEQLQQMFDREEVRTAEWLTCDDVPNRMADINRAVTRIVDGWHEDRGVPRSKEETHDWLQQFRELHHHMDDAGEYLYEHLHVLATCEHNWIRKVVDNVVQEGFVCFNCHAEALKP